jgi:predicted RNase H-like HicB family nuclease
VDGPQCALLALRLSSGGPRIQSEIRLTLSIQLEREDDGRWIAEVPELPGVLAYGATADEARTRVQALALRVVADRIDHGESSAALLRLG